MAKKIVGMDKVIKNQEISVIPRIYNGSRKKVINYVKYHLKGKERMKMSISSFINPFKGFIKHLLHAKY